MGSVVDAHLHVWDETAVGKDPGPMRVGYSAQASATVELFQDYMDEAGVKRRSLSSPGSTTGTTPTSRDVCSGFRNVSGACV